MLILEYILFPVISLVVLFVITKFMGYRQVSQLNMYDYINGITIGSITSEFIISGSENYMRPLIAMIVYALIIIFLSKIATKSIKLRKIIDGHPVIVYDNDKIYNRELNKAKMDLDEFLMLCRIGGYFNLNELQTVVLETNGSFSFYPKEKYRPTVVNDLNIQINKVNLPKILVQEGKVYHENLKLMNHDISWLKQELSVLGVSLDDILLMYQEDNSNLMIFYNNCIKKDFK